MKRRNRDGTVTDIPADEIARRQQEQNEMVAREEQAKQRRADALSNLDQRGNGPPTREEFEALKAAVRELLA